MTDFSLLIKPSAADCNLRCAYCFYIGRQGLTEPHPRMSDDVLERTIAGYMGTLQTRSHTFSWQGGEPGLMGLRFFEKAVKLQVKHAPRGAVVCNAFQTNGTLITDELAAFLAEYRFLFGVSMDGPAQVHDHYRKTREGMPSQASVLKGIDRLKRAGVEFNILALVNNRTVKQPREIYGYFKKRGFFINNTCPAWNSTRRDGSGLGPSPDPTGGLFSARSSIDGWPMTPAVSRYACSIPSWNTSRAASVTPARWGRTAASISWWNTMAPSIHAISSFVTS